MKTRRYSHRRKMTIYLLYLYIYLYLIVCYFSLESFAVAVAVAGAGLHSIEALTASSSIEQCANLLQSRSSSPVSIMNIRPRDISTVMALGDSLTNGFAAKSHSMFHIGNWSEYPGISYATGGDPGTLSLPHFLAHYKGPGESVYGVSRGHRPMKSCLMACSNFLLYRYPGVDGLNAAITGGTLDSIPNQIRYLIDEARKLPSEALSGWKLIHLFIGSNDLCADCHPGAHSEAHAQESAQRFEIKLRENVALLRSAFPRSLVRLVQFFNVSLYRQTEFESKMGSSDDHDDSELPISGDNWVMQHIVCPCLARKTGVSVMNLRLNYFNEAIRNVYWSMTRAETAADRLEYPIEQEVGEEAREENASGEREPLCGERLYRRFPKYDDFGVILSPLFKNLAYDASEPMPSALTSDFDRTHPSAYAHASFSVAIWNELFQSQRERDVSHIRFPVPLYCPTERDRIRVV